jgi:molybdenum cofactor synthesis domain-containing protein
MRALVVTVSTRAAAGDYADRTGPVIVDALTGLGFAVDGPTVVPDGPEIESILSSAVHDDYDVVITTGGTGLSPTDVTPEHTMAIVRREVPGLAEAIRLAGLNAAIATAALSRGVAGIAGNTLIVNLPGSPGGVKDGLVVLEPVLVHAVEQLRGGGDHGVTS